MGLAGRATNHCARFLAPWHLAAHNPPGQFGIGLLLLRGSGIVKARQAARAVGRAVLGDGVLSPSDTGDLYMNLTISGHHLEVTPALRSYVTSKLDRITRHFDQVVDVKVLLSVEKQKEKEKRQRAECNIHVKGSDLFAESAHADLYAAVDELVDKMDRQVVRHKDRIQDHHSDARRRLVA
jgi:putative sigma-54 modulation protein